MPRKGGRDMVKEQHWRDVLKEWRTSGVSGAEFCRVHGIKYDQFHDWRKVIGVRDAEELAAQRRASKAQAVRRVEMDSQVPSFVQARIAEASCVGANDTSDSRIEIVLLCGTLVRVNPKCSLEYLMSVVSALEERSC
jgi:hypothetical protein